MKYISVLTPPLLVCAAFLVAVVAFLRHEMGGGRQRSEDLTDEDIPDGEPIPGPEPDTRADGIGGPERRANN